MNKLEKALNFTKKTIDNTLGFVRPKLEDILGLENNKQKELPKK